MTKSIRMVLLVCAMLISAFSLSAQTVRQDNDSEDLKPTGKGWGERDLHANKGDANANVGKIVKILNIQPE